MCICTHIIYIYIYTHPRRKLFHQNIALLFAHFDLLCAISIYIYTSRYIYVYIQFIYTYIYIYIYVSIDTDIYILIHLWTHPRRQFLHQNIALLLVHFHFFGALIPRSYYVYL